MKRLSVAQRLENVLAREREKGRYFASLECAAGCQVAPLFFRPRGLLWVADGMITVFIVAGSPAPMGSICCRAKASSKDPWPRRGRPPAWN